MKIRAYVFALALLVALMLLISCEKPDIYTLVETILKDKGAYHFEADLDVLIKGGPAGAVPGELNFKIKGRAKGGDAEMELSLVKADGEDMAFSTAVHIRDGLLWFELGELPKIVSDLLGAVGLVDMQVLKLFDELAGYGGEVLYVEVDSIDLKWFERYGGELAEIFTVKSKVTYDRPEQVDIPERELPQGLNFGKIKGSIEKELLKYPYYRYSELYVVLESAEDGKNYINVLATRESGEWEILEKLGLDCNLAAARESFESVYSSDILPMRYLMELLGETVGWDEGKRMAYVLDGGNKIYVEGTVINSRTYIPLHHFITRTDYIVNSVSSGEYIEFKIIRR